MSAKLVTNTPNDKCPCKDCINRFVGCHSSCVLYIDWRQQKDVRNSELQKYKDAKQTCYDGFSRRNKQLKEKGVNFGRKRNEVMVQDNVHICPICGGALRKVITDTDITFVCNDKCRHILKVIDRGQSERELKCEVIT